MHAQPFTVHSGKKHRGAGLPAHAHDEAQLTLAVSGIVQLHTESGRWLVPPNLAVWVPAGVMHRTELLTEAELWMVHLQQSALKSWAPPTLPGRPFALRVTPLLRSLFEAIFAGSSGQEKKTEIAIRLMLHELTEVTDAPTFLPLPTNAAAKRVAALALDDHANRVNLLELASRAATSVRTVSRIFPVETGLTFKAWRQRARIVHAMQRLSRGDSIAQVSGQVGFANTAAFAHAFRQVTDMTPSAYLGLPKSNGFLNASKRRMEL